MDVLLIHSGTYARPFEDHGHRVATYGHAPGAEFSVQAAIDHAGFTPDWILVELFGPRSFLRGVESCDLPIAAYVYDSPLNHFWLRHYLPLFDAAFVDFPDSIEHLRTRGTQALWSPYAIDPANFPEPAEDKQHDLAFVGASVGRPRREALLELLRANFDIVTGGAARHGDPGRMTLRESAEIYARSRIVVNECLIDGPNFRAFEAMASGALLLTEETRNGLPDLFRRRRALRHLHAEQRRRARALLPRTRERTRRDRGGRARARARASLAARARGHHAHRPRGRSRTQPARERPSGRQQQGAPSSTSAAGFRSSHRASSRTPASCSKPRARSSRTTARCCGSSRWQKPSSVTLRAHSRG